MADFNSPTLQKAQPLSREKMKVAFVRLGRSQKTSVAALALQLQIDIAKGNKEDFIKRLQQALDSVLTDSVADSGQQKREGKALPLHSLQERLMPRPDQLHRAAPPQ